nr:peptidase M14 [Bacteroidales bacterium]
NRRADSNVEQISGAIFEVIFDPSHPLAYGLNANTLPVFKTGTSVAELPENEYNSPFRYTSTPLKSGYSSMENVERIKNSPFIIISRLGQGNVISILDNTNFRGFWYGSNKVFANAVFFGQTL